jgi:hypothetical protein
LRGPYRPRCALLLTVDDGKFLYSTNYVLKYERILALSICFLYLQRRKLPRWRGMARTTQVPAKRRRGRPPLGRDIGKRAPLSLRTTKQLKRELENRSNETGRSIAQEVEYCLEAWLAFEQGLGGKHMTALFRRMAGTAMLIEAELGRGSTMTDFRTFLAVEEAWKEIINVARPEPDAETVEGIAEIRRLVDAIPQEPQYPHLPPPKAFSGFGLLGTPEPPEEDKVRIREWQEQRAQWQAELAEHQQKIKAGLAKFERYKEIGRQAGQTATGQGGPRSRLAMVIGDQANQSKRGSTENDPES